MENCLLVAGGGGATKFLDYSNKVDLTTTYQSFDKDGVVWGMGATNGRTTLYINDVEVAYADGYFITPLFLVKKGQSVKKTTNGGGAGSTHAYFIPFLD